jgi:hypothetical protein
MYSIVSVARLRMGYGGIHGPRIRMYLVTLYVISLLRLLMKLWYDITYRGGVWLRDTRMSRSRHTGVKPCNASGGEAAPSGGAAPLSVAAAEAAAPDEIEPLSEQMRSSSCIMWIFHNCSRKWMLGQHMLRSCILQSLPPRSLTVMYSVRLGLGKGCT